MKGGMTVDGITQSGSEKQAVPSYLLSSLSPIEPLDYIEKLATVS